MKTKCCWGTSPLIALALLSMTSVVLILAPAVISEPGGTTIAVPPGGEFVLRFRLRWDQAEPGTYAIPLAWDSPRPVVGGVMQDRGTPSENFTLVGASAYFDNGDAIGTKAELLEGPSPDNENVWRYGVIVANVAADPRNGEFNVDVLFRAAGAGGVPHAVTENHPIVIMGTIDVVEKAMFMYTPPNPYVTISVLFRGVAVEISPNHQSGAPGATLGYTVLIKNAGLNDDEYELTVSDNAGWMPSISPTSLMIPAGESKTATLSVTIPPTVQSGAVDRMTVTATSRENAEVSTSGNCVARATAETIARKVGISISPGSTSGAPGSTLDYTISVKNLGNVEDSYKLEISGATGWSPRIEPTSLTIAAGEVGRATLKLTVPSDASEGDSITALVTATSQTDSTVGARDACEAIVGQASGPSLAPIAALMATAAIATTCALYTIRKHHGRKGRRRASVLRK